MTPGPSSQAAASLRLLAIPISTSASTDARSASLIRIESTLSRVALLAPMPAVAVAIVWGLNVTRPFIGIPRRPGARIAW